MAGRQGLSPGTHARRAFLFLGGVLLAHLLVLQWVHGSMRGPAALRGLSEPLFTRVLMPQDAPAALPDAQTPAVSEIVEAPAGLHAVLPSRAASASASSPAASTATALGTADAASASASSAPLNPAASDIVATANAPLAATSGPHSLAASAASAQASLAPASDVTAQAPHSDPWPRDTRVHYRLEGDVRGGALYGSAQVQWQRQEGRYQARISIDLGLLGAQSMTSQGEVTAQQLVPRLYEEQRRTRRRLVRLEDAVVVLADGRQVERPAHVQDTASQFIELGRRLARSSPAAGQTLEIWLARPGGVDLWIYDILAQEPVLLPRAGEVMAWRLRPRRPASAKDNIAAEIWFAPRLQYLPVRILLTQGAEARIDLQVETIEQR